ncbi:MAG: trigger factor [Candidatus Nitrohelix vancouverensis]|uniref:Trigger factor n=1 Tax=Candidatus Nitrohelix vancouverensis TaxID=2705534 RepID=A0A7T0C3Q0_9BACT|nr:MAG: trigger factor [Candidatus Nitrohelix vancouverensis]
MQVEVEKLEGMKRKLKIVIPEDVLSQRVDDAYKVLNRQLKMPGFRPGKIPQKVLEQQVPLQSLTEMFQELMQEHYERALEETGLTPSGAPEIDHSELADIKKDEPLKFSVIVDVRAKIDLIDYKGMKLRKKEIIVTDEQLEEGLQILCNHHGYLEHHDDDHKVQHGDFLTLDFEGFMDGEPLEEGSAKDYHIRVGEKKMIAGFEDQLLGHALGESFEVKVPLPQQWNNKIRRVSMPVPGAEGEDSRDLAVFKVNIKEVKKLVPMALDDKLAKKEGCKSVDDLKRKVKTEMQAYGEQREEIRVKEKIFNIIVKKHDAVPPESMIETELKYMLEGMKYQIQQSGMSLEDSGFDPENAKKEWRERATFNSKGYMILEEIANKEKLHITKEDMDLEYQKLAEETKQKVEDVRKRMMANQETLQQTSSKLRGQKAMNYIYSNCEFEYYQGEDDPIDADEETDQKSDA